ncbi:type II toxin-antitoxin system RelE/ParE family toxin [Salmonella enterica]|nr:type II toxin-antitoxin system RelE/ParE family toxin [Salmonella enterica]
MTYKLAFNESALKEWKKLGHTIQEQFKKKLRERLENPRVPASQLLLYLNGNFRVINQIENIIRVKPFF